MRYVLPLVLMLLQASPSLSADAWPNRPVRVIVPFAAGGGVDFTGRVVSQQLSEQLRTPFLVDNRTGASGTIANAMVAKAAPDGYTLMVIDTSTAIVPGLFKSLPFDVAKDFTAISEVFRAPEALEKWLRKSEQRYQWKLRA